jgi:hypothetical protein
MDNHRLRSLCRKAADAVSRACDGFVGKADDQVHWDYVADQLYYAHSWLDLALQYANARVDFQEYGDTGTCSLVEDKPASDLEPAATIQEELQRGDRYRRCDNG